MWHVSVAIPAGLAISSLGHHVVDAACFHKLLIQLRVVANAVVHNHFGAAFLSRDGLPLAVGHKVSHMLHAIHAFKQILVGDIVMWHMAIIALGIATMRTVNPRGVIGCHDVTVHTGT